MQSNKVYLSKLEFGSFLHRLSQNPVMELDDLSRGFDHVSIYIGREDKNTNRESCPTLHIVTDSTVYQKLANLPRADELRRVIIGEDGVTSLLTAPHAEHHDRKIAMMRYLRRSKVTENLAMMSEIIDVALGRWQREGRVSPFAEAQAIAAHYFSRYAFGVVPSEQEATALADASLISNKVNLRIATDPHHYPCLQPLAEPRGVHLLSQNEKMTLAAKQKWTKDLIARRIERDKDRSFSEEPGDLLDVVLRQAVVSQGGKQEGTLGVQMEALGGIERCRVAKQAAKEVSSLMTAATETTPTMIAYAMYIVAHNQRLQADLYHELKECGQELCAGSKLDAYALMDKNKMPVLQGVISGSLTKHPPASFSFPRQVNDDTKVGVLDFRKGDIVVFHLSRLQQPFHSSEYMCAGKTVAELEASVTLARTFSSLRIEPYAGASIPAPKRNSTVSAPGVDVPLRVYIR